MVEYFSQDFKREIVTKMEIYSLFDLYRETRDKNWDMKALSANPNITMEMIFNHPEIPWDYLSMLENPNYVLDDRCNSLLHYSRNPTANIDFVLKKFNKKSFKQIIRNLVRYNLKMTLEIVLSILSRNRDFKKYNFNKILFEFLSNPVCNIRNAIEILKLSKHPVNHQTFVENIQNFCAHGNINITDVINNPDFPWHFSLKVSVLTQILQKRIFLNYQRFWGMKII